MSRMARTGSQAGPAAEPDDFERDDGNKMIIKVNHQMDSLTLDPLPSM